MNTNAPSYSVRILRGDMSKREVAGFPVLAGALAFARDMVVDEESTFIAAHVLDGERVLSTVTCFDYPARCTGCEQYVYEDASAPPCPHCFPS